jgi:pseudaminic acid biosynthesis-associated methylase
MTATKERTSVSDESETKRLEALWGGEFGDRYVERNLDDGSARRPFWASVLELIGARSVLEVGCNVGGNLRALAGLLGPENVAGIDVNERALALLREAEPAIRTEIAPARSLPFDDGSFDLVFTTGVLIHQPPDALPDVVDEIVRCARRFVLCGEYHADTPSEVPYRGERGALFKRDFGALYEERHPGLRLIDRRFLARDGVWDDLTVWIFEKPA